MKAVSENGWALQYATEELRGDPEIVMQVVSDLGGALEFATQELRGDREIVMKALSKFGDALQFATKELRGDREIVMIAVSQHGLALRYASKELKGDEEMLQLALAGSQNCSELVGLKVVLLSGRCCTELFFRDWTPMSTALRDCAESLELDPDHVQRNGAQGVRRGRTQDVDVLQRAALASDKGVFSQGSIFIWRS